MFPTFIVIFVAQISGAPLEFTDPAIFETYKGNFYLTFKDHPDSNYNHGKRKPNTASNRYLDYDNNIEDQLNREVQTYIRTGKALETEAENPIYKNHRPSEEDLRHCVWGSWGAFKKCERTVSGVCKQARIRHPENKEACKSFHIEVKPCWCENQKEVQTSNRIMGLSMTESDPSQAYFVAETNDKSNSGIEDSLSMIDARKSQDSNEIDQINRITAIKNLEEEENIANQTSLESFQNEIDINPGESQTGEETEHYGNSNGEFLKKVLSGEDETGNNWISKLQEDKSSENNESEVQLVSSEGMVENSKNDVLISGNNDETTSFIPEYQESLLGNEEIENSDVMKMAISKNKSNDESVESNTVMKEISKDDDNSKTTSLNIGNNGDKLGITESIEIEEFSTETSLGQVNNQHLNQKKQVSSEQGHDNVETYSDSENEGTIAGEEGGDNIESSRDKENTDSDSDKEEFKAREDMKTLLSTERTEINDGTTEMSRDEDTEKKNANEIEEDLSENSGDDIDLDTNEITDENDNFNISGEVGMQDEREAEEEMAGDAQNEVDIDNKNDKGIIDSFADSKSLENLEGEEGIENGEMKENKEFGEDSINQNEKMDADMSMGMDNIDNIEVKEGLEKVDISEKMEIKEDDVEEEEASGEIVDNEDVESEKGNYETDISIEKDNKKDDEEVSGNGNILEDYNHEEEDMKNTDSVQSNEKIDNDELSPSTEKYEDFEISGDIEDKEIKENENRLDNTETIEDNNGEDEKLRAKTSEDVESEEGVLDVDGVLDEVSDDFESNEDNLSEDEEKIVELSDDEFKENMDNDVIEKGTENYIEESATKAADANSKDELAVYESEEYVNDVPEGESLDGPELEKSNKNEHIEPNEEFGEDYAHEIIQSEITSPPVLLSAEVSKKKLKALKSSRKRKAFEYSVSKKAI